MNSKTLIASLALATAAVAPTAQAADWSANLGFNSNYIFRGIPQAESSAFGGVDVGVGGFYGGIWSADVDDGLEIDYYAGYNYATDDWNIGAGFTIYTYTGDFDDTYSEINLNAGWRWLSFSANIGEYDNFGAETLEYQFYSATAEYNGFHGTVGTFADDFEGSYYELGYGNTLSVNEKDLFDYGVQVIYSDSTLLGGESDTNLNFSISKTFDF